MVSPTALLERLIDEAGRTGSFTFHAGTRLADVIHDGGRVAGARVVDADGPHDWPADLVVGCDGRGSSVRTRAGLSFTNVGEQ